MEDAYARHVLTMALSLGQFTCVRPVKRSLNAVAQLLGLPRRHTVPTAGRMSDRWLREHETDAEKHGVTFTHG